MPEIIVSPRRVEAGIRPTLVDELVGRVNSTPDAGGAHDVAVCLPAFSPATVHPDED